MDAAKVRLAEKIDTWVMTVVNNGGGDEQLLEGMYAYMDAFKQLLDTCSKLEMTLLAQRYDGFYRFANLLERLAQGIADGVIEVPADASLPGKTKRKRPLARKRPLKPKPQRQRQQIRHTRDKLPLFTEMIRGTLNNTEEQTALFMAARDKPHVLDDATVDRALRAYQEQIETIPLHERQLRWWLEEPMTEAQQYQVNDLLAQLTTLRERTQAVLDLLTALRQGTIDRILEMDDAELGRRFLRGELGKLPGWE